MGKYDYIEGKLYHCKLNPEILDMPIWRNWVDHMKIDTNEVFICRYSFYLKTLSVVSGITFNRGWNFLDGALVLAELEDRPLEDYL